jgi:hypothetical protein
MYLIEKRPRRDELLRGYRRTRNRLPGFSVQLEVMPRQ